ncbi:MAG: ABC transporter substrate-binding protein [Lachnospiraceae bacterium]|nr:ABC transporter substrate-binding protein [Lachnospiraceae bacterium]
MKNLSAKRVLYALTAVILLLTAGCGNQNASTGDQSVGSSQEDAQGTEKENAGMGRYAEREIDLTDDLEIVSGMRRFSDGRLIITDETTGIWESTDQGETWENMKNPWLDEKMNSAYFMDIQMAPDGTLGVIFNDYSGESNEQEQSDSLIESDRQEQSDNSMESGGQETGNEQEENEEEASVFDSFSPECMLISPDGTEIPVELSLSEDEMYPSAIWFSDSGRTFVTTLGDKIYEIDKDGRGKLFLTAEGRPELVQFQGNLMIVDGYDFAAPLLYDMEKGEAVEAEEFASFIKENYQDRGFNGGSWYDLYLFPGKEGELYLAGDKGLHRYLLEENKMEQLIDGSLSRLGSPLYSLKNMTALENGEFLAVSSAGKLVRFTYDPDMPSVPEESLKVYSLKDSYSVRTAISLYQFNHPEVYVEYEIGMAQEDAVTREDALKNLNTRIMAGEGPDVLMLDGLPMDSYMEKGLLLDLTDLMAEIGREEDLYENIYQNMAKDGKVYMVPAIVYLPVALGRGEYISGMKDLESIADEICRIREDNPGKDILYQCNAKKIMKSFAPISAPAWKNDSGEINVEAIGEFLTQMKRIYDAQMDGLNEKSITEHLLDEEYYVREYGEDWLYDITWYTSNEIYFVGDYLQFSMGITSYPYGYWELASTAKNKGFEDAVFTPVKGLCENVYIPATILGINAATEKGERAEEFFRVFLGKEIQTALGSYVINKEALEESFKPEEKYVSEDGEYGMQAVIDEDGRETHFTVFIATEKEMNTFRSWMESADTPYIEDIVLEKTVFEAGEKYVQEEQSLEQTLEAVRQQLSIYFSE